VYVVLGTVPGAVVGGRLVHGAVFAEAYVADPRALVDLTTGSISLLGAVVGGALSAAYIARLLGGRVARWADAAAVPLLVAIVVGKLAQLFGGGGMGAPFDGPSSVALTGPGPWHSVDPTTPAHPSQLYEGLWTAVGLAAAVVMERRGTFRRVGGVLFVVAVGWWLVGRWLIAFTWRDDRPFALLTVEQLVSVTVLGIILAVAVRGRHALRNAAPSGVPRYRDELTRDDDEGDDDDRDR
jgi:prolipoprotein diacylglyceryltransferase